MSYYNYKKDDSVNKNNYGFKSYTTEEKLDDSMMMVDNEIHSNNTRIDPNIIQNNQLGIGFGIKGEPGVKCIVGESGEKGD